MKLKVASLVDLDRLCEFYQAVCNHQVYDEYGADWHWGIYPDEDTLRKHLEKEEVLYLGDTSIQAACIYTLGDDPIYSEVKWKYPQNSQDCGSLHLVAVHPTSRGFHLANVLMERVIAFLKEKELKVIHLDVVKGNLPASRLYVKHGFEYYCDKYVFYEDTGDICVELYEKNLKNHL